MALPQRELVIDGQVFQTEAWHRGMGKYSLSLISSLKELMASYGSTKIILNQNLQAQDKAIETLKAACPSAELIYLDLGVPTPSKTIKQLQPYNQKILSEKLGKETVDYLILSLFIDEACVVFPYNARKLLLFYDLIPFLYHQRYKNRINYANYLAHFKTIFSADLIFTISQTVADDLEVYLGLKKSKLCNIDGASIDRSKLPSKKPVFDIPSKFILMPSGDELRKNNHRAVKGFEEFNSAYGNEYTLVLTSRFSDYTKQELLSYSTRLLFTGNIPEQELQWLYENAELILFASEYEGLGLPVLEAASAGKKIACSDIPVFREISDQALYLFDQFDTSSISRIIRVALTSNGWAKKRKGYKNIMSKYTWANTGKKFLKGLQILPEDYPKESKAKKSKIAVLTPHPAGFSAIGKVVAESHDDLSQYFEVDYYFDYGVFHKPVRPDYLSSIAGCFEATEFNAKKYAQYDAVIYHIGNSDYHLETIKNALYLPGYIILHDTFLDGAFESLERAEYISKERRELELLLNELNVKGTSRFLTSIVNNQLGVITHSRYAADAVNDLLEHNTSVVPVNLPVVTPELINNQNSESFQIGLAGILADVKGLAIVEEIASSDIFKNCLINIFGFSFAKPEIVKQFAKWSHVKINPDPTDFEFQTKLSKLNVLINYRLEYRGETSLTALEAMRYGVPVIVKGDIGWYAELPDEVVIKAQNPESVIEKLIILKDDKHLVNEVGKKARQLTATKFTHVQYALGIKSLLENVISIESALLNRATALRTTAPLKVLKKYINKSQA